MRYLTPEINRFFVEEAKMAFIAGPRQVGKTTLAKHLLSQIGMEAFYFVGFCSRRDDRANGKAHERWLDFGMRLPAVGRDSGIRSSVQLSLDLGKYPLFRHS